ncbi:MAG: anhydro-N-acetylmuramic acid kinase, partial [Candidatus Omnitrophica bacterium]|nr:anhydro-N-acetylmuramic acid kinase [Candidatus Omnitrophota bacterium]
QAKEPAAFAFLALRALQGRINHLPSTTGAHAACILGTITLGKHRR